MKGGFCAMRKKFGVRTVLIPVFAVLGFFVIQLLVSILYIIVLFVVPIISSGSAGNFNISENDIQKIIMSNVNGMGIVYSIIISGIAILVIKLLLIKNPYAVRRERMNPSEFIAAGLAMVGVAGVVTLVVAGIQALGQIIPLIDSAMKDYIKLSESFIGSGNIILVIISTCILIPISEDLVFRGIIQGELRRVMPGWTAVIIQGIIFALVHGNPIQITYVIIPAIILGAVYEWSKSIYVPITLHMIFNFVGAAVPMMIAGNEKAQNYYVVVELAFIPVAIIALIFLYIRRKKDPVPTPANEFMAQDYNRNFITANDVDIEKINHFSNNQANNGNSFTGGIFENIEVNDHGEYYNTQNNENNQNNQNNQNQQNQQIWKHKDIIK